MEKDAEKLALSQENFVNASTPEQLVAAARPPASLALIVLATLAVLAALYFARDAIIPIVLAILLALLLRPLQRRMQRIRIPDFLSALVLIGAMVLAFAVGVWMLADQARGWLAQAPQMVEKVSGMLPTRSGPLTDLKRASSAVEELTRGNETEPLTVEVQSSETAVTILGVSGHFIGAAVIVFVLAYFLLAMSDKLMRQAVESQASFFEKRNIVQLVQNVEVGISRYLLTITAINIGLGVVTGLVMWMLRIPNPILWGVMATTLNYVPHVGAFLCMVVLFFVGSVAHQSLGYGAAVAGAFAVLTSVESYVVTPLVLSKSLQLSPLTVIVAILFWGWMWGIPGGLMAAPLVTVLKVVCDQFQSLRPWSAFLAGQSATDMAEEGGAAPAAPRKAA
ncbi:MAG TPA: AI-2E family transporter [Pirellulaceae bacterium]|nr:AI-2E family transporter [Pirellulaceae bacterium]